MSRNCDSSKSDTFDGKKSKNHKDHEGHNVSDRKDIKQNPNNQKGPKGGPKNKQALALKKKKAKVKSREDDYDDSDDSDYCFESDDENEKLHKGQRGKRGQRGKKKDQDLNIGEGTYGQVFVPKYNPTIVIKKIQDTDFFDDGVCQSTLREIISGKLLELAHQAKLVSDEEYSTVVSLQNIVIDDEGHVLLTMNREETDLLNYLNTRIELAKRSRHPSRYNLRSSKNDNQTGQASEVSQVGQANQADPKSEQIIDLPQVKDIMYQVLLALRQCHMLNISHRDIKPENVLLTMTKPTANTKTIKAKLADFGLARLCPVVQFTGVPSYTYHETEMNLPNEYNKFSDVYSEGNLACTLGFRPPELLTNTKKYIPEAIDIWSSGVLMWKLLMKTFPADTKEDRQRIRYLLETTFKDNLTCEELVEIQTEMESNDFVEDLNSYEREFITMTEHEVKTNSNVQKCDSVSRRVWISKLIQLYGTDVTAVLFRMLAYDPHDRIKIDELVHHPIFAEQHITFGKPKTTDFDTLEIQQRLLSYYNDVSRSLPPKSNLQSGQPAGGQSQVSKTNASAKDLEVLKHEPKSKKSKQGRQGRQGQRGQEQDLNIHKTNYGDYSLTHDEIKLFKALYHEYRYGSSVVTTPTGHQGQTPTTDWKWLLVVYELMQHTAQNGQNKLEAYAYACDLFERFMNTLYSKRAGEQGALLDVSIFDSFEINERQLLLLIAMACGHLMAKITSSEYHMPDLKTMFSHSEYLKMMTGNLAFKNFRAEWVIETEIWILKMMNYTVAVPNAMTMSFELAKRLGITSPETKYNYAPKVLQYGIATTTMQPLNVGPLGQVKSIQDSFEKTALMTPTTTRPTTNKDLKDAKDLKGLDNNVYNKPLSTTTAIVSKPNVPMAKEKELLLLCMCDPFLLTVPPILLGLAAIDVSHNPDLGFNNCKSLTERERGVAKSSLISTSMTSQIQGLYTEFGYTKQEYEFVYNAVLEQKQKIPLVNKTSSATNVWAPIMKLFYSW